MLIDFLLYLYLMFELCLNLPNYVAIKYQVDRLGQDGGGSKKTQK
jgi:hypothetical protein